MKKLTQEELDTILEKHQLWLKDDIEGEYADLSNADLRNADLCYANLCYADLSGADLRNADLSGANLRGADLRNADLRNADLSGAILSGANLFGTSLFGAKLDNVSVNNRTLFYALQCPEEGSFVGWKKAAVNSKQVLIKLLIPEDAKRSSATTQKCRASKAKVLAITSLDGAVEYKEAHSNYYAAFIYRVGETVEVSNFNEDRWVECAPGIHFFVTKKEAIEY